jgi:CO dehydrogenase nickel-insertion accessory protein CooC1
MNPTLPSFRAVKRIMALADKLPVNIGHRAVVVTRVGPQGIPEPVMAGLAELNVQRLIDVPQDDSVERAGAIGESVFTLPGDSPALVAAGQIVDTLRATLTSKS